MKQVILKEFKDDKKSVTLWARRADYNVQVVSFDGDLFKRPSWAGSTKVEALKQYNKAVEGE